MPRFAANLSMMFGEVAFLDRFGRAAAAGFRGVEYLFPYAHGAEEIRARLDGADLAQALFNTPPGDWEAGERGFAAAPGGEATFEAHLAQALDYAAILKPERLHVMAGVHQGEDARRAYIANLKRACAAAPSQRFVIEPINTRDMPGYHIATTTDALSVIEAVGADNLALQLDLYHAQIMEGDLTRRIEAIQAAGLIGHVQIAGAPERHEPDRGETAFAHLMATLDRVGYQGWVGCEYRPAGRTEDGLGWFAPFKAAP